MSAQKRKHWKKNVRRMQIGGREIDNAVTQTLWGRLSRPIVNPPPRWLVSTDVIKTLHMFK
jgi:hypothetical protein